MSYVEVSLPRLAAALAFVAVGIALSRRLELGVGRRLVVGALRAAVQLLAVGYFLLFLIAHQSPESVFGVLAVMLLVAAVTSARRIEHGPPARVLFRAALVAIAFGAAAALVPLFVIIAPPRPWFDPRYLVPFGGMMFSNAMNVVAQVFERMFAASHADRATIEQLLALGASPRQALSTQTRAAVRAALIPTMNGLATVGLVTLPGMMTGQIISGIGPELAVRYQLVVMYQLVAVASISGALAAFFARRLMFTPREQLRED